MPKVLSKEYIAGLIDGEGCLNIHLNSGRNCYFTGRIMVGMADDKPLKMLKEQYGGTIQIRKTRDSWKDCYLWYLSGTKLELFLNDIYPYLIIKKEQAEILLLLRESKNIKGFNERVISFRQELKNRIHKLNYRGNAKSI